MKLAIATICALIGVGVTLHTYHTIHNVEVMYDVNVIERQNNAFQ